MGSQNSTARKKGRVTIRVATTLEEYATAFRIAYEVYYPKRFTPYAASGMRATAYQLKPSALVLLAYQDDTPVGTLTIYEGPAHTLPSSSGWPMELRELEDQNIKAIEIGALMILPAYTRTASLQICLSMFRVAWHYAALVKKVNAFCAFVQTHHQRFYENALGFTNFGPARHYRWNGLDIGDVIPLMMDLDGAEAKFKQRFSRFGRSSRNLYRFFVHDRRREIETDLRDQIEHRESMDWDRLRRHFAHLIETPSPKADIEPPGSESKDDLEIPAEIKHALPFRLAHQCAAAMKGALAHVL